MGFFLPFSNWVRFQDAVQAIFNSKIDEKVRSSFVVRMGFLQGWYHFRTNLKIIAIRLILPVDIGRMSVV